MSPRLAGLAPLLLLSGCVGTLCRGPGCEAVWPAGQVLIMQPFEADIARPATALATLSGTADEGAEWTAATLGTDVYVGMPEANEVVRWTPGEDGDSVRTLPDWRGPLRELGARVVAVDLAGNNVPSLWMAAPGADLDAGAVVIWANARQDGRTPDASAVLFGAEPADRLGESLLACPDLTGDGVRDMLLAAPHAEAEGLERAGAVFLVPSELALAGPLAFDTWSAGATRWHVDRAGAALGRALACGEDLTGDGVPDLVLGAPGYGAEREGAVWVLDGSALPAAGPLGAPTRTGSAASAWLGSGLAVGDLDGDGIGDLAIGAAGAAAGTGEVAVHYGPELAVPRTIIEGPAGEEPAHLGRGLLIADLDGDELDELVLGAPDAVDGEDFDAGYVGVWRGSPLRLAPNLALGEDEDWALAPDHAFQRLGGELAASELGLVLAVRSRGF